MNNGLSAPEPSRTGLVMGIFRELWSDGMFGELWSDRTRSGVLREQGLGLGLAGG